MTDRATPLATIGGLIASMALLLGGAPCARAQQPSVSREQLAGYIDSAAHAWEAYTTPDGRVMDPLDSTDTGDNYGVIMLADVMLKAAAERESAGDEDVSLAKTATRILGSAMTLPAPTDPFNLLAIASLLHDGQRGAFPPEAWAQLDGPVSRWAGQIGIPTGINCLTEPACYNNWRLVWSAGASLLLEDEVEGAAGSLAANPATTRSLIADDLQMALADAGAPLQGSPATGAARELSDPGAEPPSYHLFSTFMLETIATADPGAITHSIAALRDRADRYALDLMAPDGQLSLAGRSLDQSWVQAAAVALGARQAEAEPADAGVWHSYGDRALSYLLTAYPIRPDGIPTIIPGLGVEWNREIMDGYAAVNQYGGLTLWFLSQALDGWPRVSAPRAPLPADSTELLENDLHSSGLVWGRSANVWWEVSGRSKGADPRSAQGLVGVKVRGTSGWRDLLALRPRVRGLSSTWTLTLPHGGTAIPIFTSVRGDGARAVLDGSYRRPNGRVFARARWILTVTAQGIGLRMSMPAHTMLHTTVWLANGDPSLRAQNAAITAHPCTVTASGRACPVTVRWARRRAAALEVAAQAP